MWAIYKRELKSYFRSFIGFLFIAATLFFVSLYFFVYNMLSGYPYISYAISSVTFLFMITVPILSMRILAEEKHSKTDQLILTAPVSVGGIVMGKFLALLTIFLIPTAVVCTYPLIMKGFGSVPMGESYLAVLAFFLYGMTSIAIGLLISSLTESQVIAAVVSFLVLFLGYMMSSICNLISSTGNLLTKILGCFDLATPFNEMLNGTLNLQSVIYYITLTALALFLAVQAIQKRRYSVSVQTLSFGAYSTGSIALAVAVVVVINIVLGEMPTSWTSLDVTSQKLYSLTDQTKEFVEGMKEDVTIYVIASESSQDETLRQTLQRYDELSDHINVEYVDPNVNPRFYMQYTDSISMNSLIVVSDRRNKVIDYSSIYESSFDYSTYTSTTTGYDGEGQITSALDYVLSDSMPKVYMTEGHGEYTLSSSFTNAMKKENVDYETINLMDYDNIPEDAACLIINAAGSDFSADDKDKVIDYLDMGGNVVFVVGLTEGDTPNLDAITDYMGLSIAEGLVVEQDKENYYRNPYYLLPTQSYSTYTSGLYNQYYIFAPYVQGIIIENEEAEGITYNTFLSTSDKAFSKVGEINVQNFDKEEGDIDGPFGVGVSAVRKLDDETSATLIVYGCDQLFTDEANSMVSGANQVLFTNTVSSFVDHEVSVSIPAKSYEISYLTVPQSKAVLVGLMTVIVVPVGCLAAGFVIWFRRRKR
ncbi:MAG: Gldg family protein [Lachnospiraceae bacterium]|nr:Gldg family protein [Lachnospiraceae bacterium]